MLKRQIIFNMNTRFVFCKRITPYFDEPWYFGLLFSEVQNRIATDSQCEVVQEEGNTSEHVRFKEKYIDNSDNYKNLTKNEKNTSM